VRCEIYDAVLASKRRYEECPESSLPKEYWRESDYTYRRRTTNAHNSAVQSAANAFTASLIIQWPVDGQGLMVTETQTSRTYLRVQESMGRVRDMFTTWWQNRQFEEYLDEVVRVATSLEAISSPSSSPLESVLGSTTRMPPLEVGPRVQRRFLSIDDIFQHGAPETEGPQFENFRDFIQKRDVNHQTRGALEQLIQELGKQGEERHKHEYLQELRRSLDSHADDEFALNDGEALRGSVEHYYAACESRFGLIHGVIVEALKGGPEEAARIAIGANVAPRITPLLVLQQLTRHRWPHLPDAWKRSVVNYALAVVGVQRAERLVAALGNANAFMKEATNVGHKWDPMEAPEALLLEVESGLVIRDVQSDVARHMSHPDAGGSSVMQLNMGEGKSSVIAPMVAAALADGSRLVRVIVGKPQMKQLMHMTTSKLGGLLDRRIFFMPCSRSVVLRNDEAEKVWEMMKRCRREGGVLLVQPEHLLSFKLMGLENTCSDDKTARRLGKTLVDMQHWFEDKSRDIVDESDENFGVRFELVYTMGSQDSIEMSPRRWTVIQAILDIVAMSARSMHEEGSTHADGLGFTAGVSSEYPRIRILKASTGRELTRRVATAICDSGLSGFPIHRQPRHIRDLVYRYITEPDVDGHAADQLQDNDGAFSGDGIKQALLLIRGLLAGGVLDFALGQKRWTVDYGRTLHRSPPTLLAVPYRAHDSPSPRSEFSHPDVVIVLTCLTYYYAHLSDPEMRSSFESLLSSDQAAAIFGEWVAGAGSTGLDPSFHHLENISLQDDARCRADIFPQLCGVKPVIDFYLSQLVFPREMKQFPLKLSASGWDLARRTNDGNPLTGFSGTCDAKHLLPLSVRHLDLPAQLHTNAAVLRCLLRPENAVQELRPPSGGEPHTASLIRAIATTAELPVQVILDVGAQIVELKNVDVARLWLRMQGGNGKDAVLFFDEGDELSVLDRRGRVEPFVISPFARETGRCLVYLDQVHTRGTDLGLPDYYRAAVTLGPNVTKDALVQGKGLPHIYPLFASHMCAPIVC
jgi:hypothetical protein